MKWPTIRELCSDDMNRLSSSRAIALAAGWSLSFSLILLSIGSFWKPEMLGTVGIIAPSAAGLGGLNYAMNKIAEKKSEP